MSRKDFLQAVRACGLVGFEQAGLFEHQQAGGGEAHHHVGPGIVLFGKEAGGDDSSGVANPDHVGLGYGLFDGGLEGAELVGFQGGVDRYRRLLCLRTARETEQGHRGHAGCKYHLHDPVPLVIRPGVRTGNVTPHSPTVQALGGRAASPQLRPIQFSGQVSTFPAKSPLFQPSRWFGALFFQTGQGSEYVLTFVKLFMASTTPSL